MHEIGIEPVALGDAGNLRVRLGAVLNDLSFESLGVGATFWLHKESAKKARNGVHLVDGSQDHRIKVEKVLPAVAYPHVPYWVDGAKACPPEDIGGGPGYAEFLEAMADPNHPEHEDMLEWYGSTFYPTVFEWERVNQRLKGD
jgi:hypothetical protein